MHGLNVLDGVDDIPWEDLQHAFGPAGDVPGLLRALMSDDAGEALDDLYSSICHQGSVYSATAYAVPFLARIAAAGIRTAGVLDLLGRIAKSDDERGVEVPGSARAAVAGQVDVLVPLLGDPADEVRALTVWALAQGRVPDRLVPVLRAHWDTEASREVKATVLKALSVLGGAAGIAEGVVAGPADAAVRLIAAEACVTAGMPWSDQLRDAATAWLTRGIELPECWWGGTIPFSGLLAALVERGESDVAIGLIATGLSPTTPAMTPAVAAGVRTQVLNSAYHLAHDYRIPLPALAVPLVAAAGDPDAGPAAIMTLQELADGPDPLAYDPAAGAPLAAAADVRGPDDLADRALALLFALGDPRAAGLLARDLPDRPIALAAAAVRAEGGPPPLPFDPVLFGAVRERLRASDMDGVGLDHMVALLSGWGPAAAPAIPELLGLGPRDPLMAGKALAAIGGAIQPAVEALKLAATTRSVTYRLDAATTLRSLTGDDEPLFAAIEHGLGRRGMDLGAAAHAAATLVSAPDRLIPALTAALAATPAATPSDEGARLQVLLALWRYTGDATAAVPAVARWLSGGPPRQHSFGLNAAVNLGAAAKPLIPVVLPLLDHPMLSPHAIQALLHIDPQSRGGVPLAELVDRLVTTVGGASGFGNLEAITVLGEIGQAGISPEARERLRHLAEHHQRIIRHIIRHDEILRAEIRHFLEDPR